MRNTTETCSESCGHGASAVRDDFISDNKNQIDFIPGKINFLGA